MSSDPPLDDLNPEQRAAVRHADGPLIVVAGPGSGKTRVITRRIAYLVRHGHAKPWQVLAITFTNKAADEMRRRVEQLIGERSGVIVSTFHSLCARMLRRHGPIGRTSGFTIYDADDQESCVKKVAKELALDPEQWKPGALLARISDAKNKRISADAFDAQAKSFSDRTIAKVYRKYEETLAQFNALDFDDLLVYMLDVLERREEVRAELRERFKYILVDEYQDTNRPQYEIANLLAGKDGNLCVVGDPDQSIYKWRGADIRNILDFEKDHPGAREIRLETNYRSTALILSAAQALIANNTERREKTLRTGNPPGDPVQVVRCFSDSEEAILVAEAIRKRLREPGARASEIAVLYRTNALSRKFEEELRARGIRHIVVGAVPFFARKEVKDVLAYLRILANPDDGASLGRAIAFAEGFGAKTLERLAERARTSGRTILETIRAPDGVDLKGAQRRAVAEFAAVIEELSAMPQEPVGPLLRAVVERTGARRRLSESKDPQDWSRAENLDALVNGAYEFDERSADQPEDRRDFRAFLDFATLLSATDQDPEQDDRVRLMTLHAAKGLEFDDVFIVGVDAGTLPYERQMEICDVEEERRLLFVGITRARKRLVLTSVGVRRTFGQEKMCRPSPFLREIPQEAVERAGGGFWAEREAMRPVDLRKPRRGWGDPREHEDVLAEGESRLRGGAAREREPGEDDGDPDGTDARFSDEEAPSRLVRRSALRPVPEPSVGAAASERELRPGDRVVHGKFGRGRVVSLDGQALGRRICVDFEGHGRKLLILHYANLQKVS